MAEASGEEASYWPCLWIFLRGVLVQLPEDKAVDVASKLLAMREDEQPRLQKIAAYMRGKQASVYVPRGARAEYRWLISRAKVNMLPLVVTAVAQSLFVDGYRPERSSDNAKPWGYWQ